MFYSRSLTEAFIDLGLMCTVAQIGKIILIDKGDTPYLNNLAIRSGWFIESNALERSVGEHQTHNPCQ